MQTTASTLSPPRVLDPLLGTLAEAVGVDGASMPNMSGPRVWSPGCKHQDEDERLHEAHPRGHGDVLVPSGSRPGGGTPSSGFRLTLRATSVRRAETTNLFLKLSFRVSFRPTEELQMGRVVPTPLARAAPLSSFTTWHMRHSEEAQTGYLLPNPRVYLDFSSCSDNILFLCQNPVRGRRLHLAVTRS